MWLHDLVQVGVLGPLLVRVGDREATPRGRRQREAFVALVQRRGRPVPAEVLHDLIWGSGQAPAGVAAVHTAVARLRRTVGAAGIARTEHGYLLDRGVSTDEDSFLELMKRARRLLADGDPVTACDTFRTALAIWRGERAFDDVRDELVEPDRARLDDVRSTVVEELAAATLEHPEAGAPAEAYTLATRLIEQHPLRERAHQLAMLASYRDHRQVRALEIYRDLQRRLHTELGIDPAPATARLHSLILGHDPSLEPRHPTSPAASGRSTWAGPPAPVSPIVGREQSVRTVRQALAAGRRLVTLTGPPGVGKSRLLMEIGAGAEAAPGRVAFVGFDGTDVQGGRGRSDPAATLASALGASDPRRTPTDALVVALSGAPCLLLVDEAERVADPLSDLLRVLLAACPHLQAVVSSRTPLAVMGEVLVPVAPLDLPPSGAGRREIRDAPAVRLLLTRLADLGIRIGDDPATTDRLASIARSTGGLPLALELLAGQAMTRSLSDIAELSAGPLDIPATARSDNPRHRTLRDAIGSSTGTLTPACAAMLRRLSVFEDDFDRAAARAVVAPLPGGPGAGTDPDESLRELSRCALVQPHRPDSDRLTWRLLPAIRALVAEQLVGDEQGEARARHRRWFADRWREADDQVAVSPTGPDELVRDVHDHLDDYLTALHSALRNRDSGALGPLTSTLARYWRPTGATEVGLRWTSDVIDSGILDPLSTARVQVQRAALALHHRPDIVLTSVDEALPTLLAHGVTGPALLAHLVRAVELCSSGRGADAMSDAQAAVALADGRGPGDRARAFSVLAIAGALAGEPERATAAVATARALGPLLAPSDRGIVATNLAWGLLHLDQPGTAQDVLDELAPLPTESTPSAQLLVRGWVLIDCWRPAAALLAFAAALTPDPPVADRLSAETFLGAGCAMAALDFHESDAVLDLAEALAAQVGLVLLPVLDRAVAAARPAGDQVRYSPAPPPDGTRVSGDLAPGDLARMLRDMVVRAATSIGVQPRRSRVRNPHLWNSHEALAPES